MDTEFNSFYLSNILHYYFLIKKLKDVVSLLKDAKLHENLFHKLV